MFVLTLRQRCIIQLTRYKTLVAYRRGNWRSVAIEASDEPLVTLPRDCSFPYYHSEMGIGESPDVYVREQVAKRFMVAGSIVRQYGFDLVAYDGWRSLSVQSNLYWHYLKKFTAVDCGLADVFRDSITLLEIESRFNQFSADEQQRVHTANQTYVSWPSSDPLRPSPHSTGGAIDVWLHRDGMPVDLGVPFDWMETNAGAFFHLKLFRESFKNDREVCSNRSLLLYAMVSAGFSCYPPEIWHFNFGNQMDGLVKRMPACYSYIEPESI